MTGPPLKDIDDDIVLIDILRLCVYRGWVDIDVDIDKDIDVYHDIDHIPYIGPTMGLWI